MTINFIEKNWKSLDKKLAEREKELEKEVEKIDILKREEIICIGKIKNDILISEFSKNLQYRTTGKGR